MTLHTAPKKGRAWTVPLFLGYAVFAVYLYLVIKVLLLKFSSLDIELLQIQWQMLSNDPTSIVERLRYRGNLVPFHEIQNYVSQIRNGQSGHSFVNLVGNIVAFMPFGLMLPLLFAKKAGSVGKVAWLSFLFSLGLETTQLVLSCGTFDVDDLLLNTVGGILGYGVYLVLWFVFWRHLSSDRSARDSTTYPDKSYGVQG
ncbi:VanZ family protein [Brevibacillus agri]|uniref:VanZ family protein n=1 Tax=Brevibacillus agri TaxID=51101 RepID=UPI001F3ED430|nr:VanZ family protein [Brevibacillus agri]MED4569052.1 VanZ family protein [Brevibacillus agri]WHX30557.1 VanZ family protein [Brevibacillus agri]